MADYWKPTAQMYTSLIDKPKMTQKLLSKPPFKYLFDIVSETTKKTGFANNLYQGPETNGDHYADKDKKIVYLEKLIKLVQLMSGEQVKAKPQKIVAGLEPQLTNALLQTVYKCASSGNDSTPYVNKVLGIAEEPAQPPKKPAGNKAPTDEKKKPERPPSARNTKKLADPIPKKVEQKHQEPEQAPQQQVGQKKTGGQGHQYSKKVKQLMEEGQQQAVAQKEAEVQQQKNQKQVTMGRLKKKAQKQDQDKVISSGGELTDKQLDLVKSMIQSICQNTAPLGKSIEFINDDIQSMNKELVYWRKQYNASKSKFQNQLKMTEQALIPTLDKLAEIEEQIKDQKSKIQTAKAQVLKNDSTIKDLLMSVVTTR